MVGILLSDRKVKVGIKVGILAGRQCPEALSIWQSWIVIKSS